MTQPSSVLPPPQRNGADQSADDWFALPEDDPVVAYLRAHLWQRGETAQAWRVTPLSHAVFLYREMLTGWSVTAKFYAAKTGDAAAAYAAREADHTQQARAAGLATGPVRAVAPLGLWRGILFLEYVSGLTVNDVIAVRRSRPGTLLSTLERTVELLARLHAGTQRHDVTPEFAPSVAYAHKAIATLEQYGVLQRDPLVADGLRRFVARWDDDSAMRAFTPVLIHGDATTTNFMLTPQGDLVAIDWERAHVSDPAADVGRLLAEVMHSITRYGGSVAEALPLLERLQTTYCRAAGEACDPGRLTTRIRFFQASSTLRIARNGWLSRRERTALVAQAMVLLA